MNSSTDAGQKTGVLSLPTYNGFRSRVIMQRLAAMVRRGGYFT